MELPEMIRFRRSLVGVRLCPRKGGREKGVEELEQSVPSLADGWRTRNSSGEAEVTASPAVSLAKRWTKGNVYRLLRRERGEGRVFFPSEMDSGKEIFFLSKQRKQDEDKEK